MTVKGLLLFSLLFYAGCSQTARDPIAYPRSMERAPPGQIRSDVDECKSMASDYDNDRNRYLEMGKGGLVGGAVGAGAGALAGTITGSNVGRATGAGAAVGGVLGVLNELRQEGDSDPSYQRFVERCLERRGYDVTGWR